MIDFQSSPVILASLITKYPTPKKNLDSLTKVATKYFRLWRNKNSVLDKIVIDEELTLLAVFAEEYTDDSIYTLFSWGIVILPNIIIIEPIILGKILNLDSFAISIVMNANSFFQFSRMPPDFYTTLTKLGYIDSVNWQAFYIPQMNDFYGYIFNHRNIVQAFPAELHELITAKTKEIRDEIASNSAATFQTTVEDKKERIHHVKDGDFMSWNDVLEEEEDILQQSVEPIESDENSEDSDYSY